MRDWLDVVERVAIGACGVSAVEFEAMTPREVQWRIEALVEHENKETERVAQLACWVLSSFGGKVLHVSDLVKLPGRLPVHQDYSWLTK